MATTGIDGATVTRSVDKDGNIFTSVTKEGLKSEDFVTLMLQELKLQDPTKPVDSSSMMEKQLQLSTLTANTKTIEAMDALTKGLDQSTLADASSMIGHIIEVSGEDNEGKQYQVSSAENKDGDVTLSVYEITGYYDDYTIGSAEAKDALLGSEGDDDFFMVVDASGEEHKIPTKGKTYEELAEELNTISGVTASMEETADGKYTLKMIVDGGGSSIGTSGIDFEFTQSNMTMYSPEAESFPYSSITKVY